MTEDQRQAADRPEAVRYRVPHTPLDAGPAGSMEASLQEGDQCWRTPKLEADQLSTRLQRRGLLTDMGHVGVLLRLESEGPRPSWCRTPARGEAPAEQNVGVGQRGESPARYQS